MVNVWCAGIILNLAVVNVNADLSFTSIADADGAKTQSAPLTILKGSSIWKLSSLQQPVITGHRGAPGYLPDHTIPGYTLAIDSGVDIIEPDLVSTKDGFLVVRHEPYIDDTTNVADHPEFADRCTFKLLDGTPTEGYFVSDFTLAEIKTLRAVQPLPERDQSFNALFQIPTFEEVIQLAQKKSAEYNRTIAIYPEIKHSSFHKRLGLPVEKTMLRLLTKYGWNHADAPVLIQSFETENLRELKKVTNLTLVQLIDADGCDPITGDVIFKAPYDWILTNRTDDWKYFISPAGLAELASYADIIAPWKGYLLKAVALEVDAHGNVMDSNGDGIVSDADYTIVNSSNLIKKAHAAGLKVHTWSMRDENYRLTANYFGNATLEYLRLFDEGIDGLFSDNCKTAVPARNAWLASSKHIETA
ncbi:putative PLC-like phosphodiesterase, TIM beta/alpha-barrel domain superfamily [Plasmopara halstedii]